MSGELQAHRAHLAAAQSLRYRYYLCTISILYNINCTPFELCIHIIYTLLSFRATLMEFRETLPESIRQLEARLEGVRGPPGGWGAEGISQQLQVEGDSNHATAPLLQIPPITVPVSC